MTDHFAQFEVELTFQTIVSHEMHLILHIAHAAHVAVHS